MNQSRAQPQRVRTPILSSAQAGRLLSSSKRLSTAVQQHTVLTTALEPSPTMYGCILLILYM